MFCTVWKIPRLKMFAHSAGKGMWSGYGARPRGKGIVDKCCRSVGCELHHLEMYCAKPKSQQHTTAYPTTTTAQHTSTQTDMVRADKTVLTLLSSPFSLSSLSPGKMEFFLATVTMCFSCGHVGCL